MKFVEPKVTLVADSDAAENQEPEEIWKPIVGYEGVYEVSDQGKVRSLDRIVHSITGKKYLCKGKILKDTPGSHGYPTVSLSKNSKIKRACVHRLVLETFIGLPKAGFEACHNNGTRSDNRLSNLRWGTSSENTQDVKRHGRMYQLKIKHCPSGHEYTDENIYLYQNRRYCRACRSGKRKLNG